jgi:RNA polymerase sigma-70 factor, ECF subfamily
MRVYTVSDSGSESRLRRFEELILPNLLDLYRTALRFTHSSAEAQDLVQETCLRAFRSLDQLKHPTAARAWTFTILRSVYLRQAERRTAESVSLDELEARPGEVRWNDLSRDSPLRGAMLQEVRRATLRLPLPLREVIVLAHIGGFSYEEIARILDVPIGTVMSRLSRGRQCLRGVLREHPKLGSETR